MTTLRSACIILFGLTSSGVGAQQTELPYREIPEAPAAYTPGAVVSRLIDGLGFRFFWATEGLRPEDLAYRHTPEARSTEETIDHIYGLTQVIVNAAKKLPNTPQEPVKMTFSEKRSVTLHRLKEASELFLNSPDPGAHTVVFNRGETQNEFPLWNLINGPVSDALWHCGQVVSNRRASGNPFNSKVSVFTGTVRQ